MVSKNLCVLVLWTKVAPALEGLICYKILEFIVFYKSAMSSAPPGLISKSFYHKSGNGLIQYQFNDQLMARRSF